MKMKKLLSVLLALLVMFSGAVFASAVSDEDTSNVTHEGRDCDWDRGLVTKEPTCTEWGEKLFRCRIDSSHTKTERLMPFGHSYTWTIDKNSTATSTGSASAVCGHDPSHTESMVIPARGAAVEVGYCGTGLNHAYYVCYEDGTLLVFGEGAIGYANYGCHASVKPTKLIIDEGITEISHQAFQYHPTIETAELPDSLRSIGVWGIHECPALRTIIFGNGLQTVYNDAFAENRALEEVVLPDNVTTVGVQAFIYCKRLKNVVIPAGVSVIGKNTFSYCTSLEKVVIMDMNASIDETAFDNIASASPQIWSFAGGKVEAFADAHGFEFVDMTPTDEPETPDTPEQTEKNPLEKFADAVRNFFETIANFFSNLFRF